MIKRLKRNLAWLNLTELVLYLYFSFTFNTDTPTRFFFVFARVCSYCAGVNIHTH